MNQNTYTLQMRVTELEIKLSLCEHSVDILDTVVTRQQTQLDKLELMCISLLGQLQQQSDGASKGSLFDELPPHY